jgi:hypothetical protein
MAGSTLVVAPDQNEITAALALLNSLPLEGAIITGNTIFCQRQLCQHIRDAERYGLFAVKRNQPEPHAAVAESFGDLFPCGKPLRAADLPHDLRYAETVKKAMAASSFANAR